jgi:hypothetical protein
MAGTNDSNKTAKGSVKAYAVHSIQLESIADALYISSKTNSPSSTTSSNDHVLVENRCTLFLSDTTPTTVPFHASLMATEQDVIHTAKKRMRGILFAFDNAFGSYTEEPPS